MRRSIEVLGACLALASSCGGPRRESQGAWVELPSPAGPGSLAPRLDLGADGGLRLAWIEPLAEGGHALRFALLEADGWSSAREIARGDGWFVNWADVPALTSLADGTLLAAWLDKLGGGAYAYGVYVACSRDQGATWDTPRLLHEDRSESEHGFVSLLALDTDTFAAVWLDGRATSSGGHEHHGDMQLRARTLDRDGSLGGELLLDERVCDCCPTGLARVQGRLLAAYRDRSAEEVRDIGLCSFGPGAPPSTRRLHSDGWTLDGCPVNGPVLDASGDRVGIAWFTQGERGWPKVLAALSSDGGASFGAPIAVAGEEELDEPFGSLSATLGSDGALWVSWLEHGREGTGSWRLRRVGPDGLLSEARVLVEGAAGRAAGIARLVAHAEGLYFAWTEVAEDGATRVRTARVRPGA